MANKITKIPKKSQQNYSETVTNEHDQEKNPKKKIHLQKKERTLLMIWD